MLPFFKTELKLEINEFYQADLIGLNVETNSGDTVGSIGAIHNFGAGNILEIIEVQSGSYLGEDDIVRHDDDFGR